jgi:hypothetical protein
LKQSIIEADFIFILFDINSVESKQSIGRKWIPVIKAFRLKEAKLEMVIFFLLPYTSYLFFLLF